MGQFNDKFIYVYVNYYIFLMVMFLQKLSVLFFYQVKYLGYRVEIFNLIFFKMVLFFGNWFLNWCDVRYNDNDVNGVSFT